MTNQDLDAACARFEGPFLDSSDMMNREPVTLKIKAITPPNEMKAADGRVIDKPIIEFEGARKMLILNKTNQKILKALFGTKASGWIGHPVTIGVRYLKSAFGQKNVPTIRIIPPEGVPIPFGVQKHFGSEKPWA